MSDRIGKCCFLTHQDVLRQVTQAFERMTQEVFPFVVDVHLLFRRDAHHIGYEIQIAEGNSCFHRVDRYAAVGAKYIVHVQFPQPLLGFLLELFRIRCEVGVLVTEDLIGDLTGQQHPDVRRLTDRLTDQVHTHARADRRDIEGTQRRDDFPQRSQHDVLVDDDLVMVASDVVSHFLRVLQVDRVFVHSDGKCLDRMPQKFRRDRAYQGTV